MNKSAVNPPPYSQAPPPGPGFNVPPPHHHHPSPPQVVIQTPVGPTPQMMTCPSCRAQIQTRMEFEPTTRTHLSALLLCILGCWVCCCIPYCMDTCQNANHYCPNCGSFIGSYNS